MKKTSWLLALACALSLSSCTALKQFLNSDLAEEDFIISQLYADELVDEKPYIPANLRTQRNTSGRTTTTNLGVQISNAKLAQVIESWYGTPYKYGGCDKNGVDCSCFVGNVYKSVYNKTLKRTANDIFQQCSVVSKSSLKEGDLVFFTNSNGKISHVGIYLSDNTFVHSSTSHGVSFSKLTDTYWNKHFYKGGRVK